MCFSVQVEKDLKNLSRRFGAVVNDKAFENLETLDHNEPGKYKYVFDEDDRIYTKIWTPIICMVKGERQIRPMRYQLLPHFCKEEVYKRVNPETNREVEIKNTFNARLDSLESANAWKKPFMNFHALLPIKQFFEWVPKNGHKSIISFKPQNDEFLLAPCLYDNWFSEDKSKIIQSFAIITDDPRPEILEMGHDRTPISISESNINKWLSPQDHDRESIYSVLKNPKHDHYEHHWEM
jgi:putative SOS response-associated peptidase YedK